MARFSTCGAYTVGKGWRRTIGRKIGDGGKLVPCRFWLGYDKPKATATALAIESLWVGINAPHWSVVALADAQRLRTPSAVEDVPESRATALLPMLKTVLTVGGLIDRYRQAKMADGQLAPASMHSIASRTKALERSPIVGMALADMGAEHLSALVAYWLNRPMSGRGVRISETSARLIAKTARAVFDYADANGLWLAPRRFERLFRLPKSTGMVMVETYSMAELTALYGQANGRMRLLMLLALNCGFCSAELATLRQDEVDLKAKIIRRRRQKTGVAMEWKLWPETATALANEMATHGVLALTANDKPLVEYIGGRRIDAITNPWRRLQKQANVGRGSFKTLRKTGATMVRSIGGIEVSEMYLSHSEKTVAKYYSVPEPKHLATALASLRRRLAPMFGR